MADTEASELQDRTREVSARKVIVSEFVTLDGVMEDPSWTAPFTGQEQEQYKFDELSAADALLIGRTTYEEFAAAWPNMMDQYEGPRRAELQEYADMMNAYPKHVVSTSLEEPLEWNNSTLMEGDVAEAVTRLKQQSGKDILVFGSGERRYPIAFDRLGEGPPVVVVGGQLCDQALTHPTAEELTKHFTVINYDRRGRGDSGDTAPYALEREIEDLDTSMLKRVETLEDVGNVAAFAASDLTRTMRGRIRTTLGIRTTRERTTTKNRGSDGVG